MDGKRFIESIPYLYEKQYCLCAQLMRASIMLKVRHLQQKRLFTILYDKIERTKLNCKIDFLKYFFVLLTYCKFWDCEPSQFVYIKMKLALTSLYSAVVSALVWYCLISDTANTKTVNNSRLYNSTVNCKRLMLSLAKCRIAVA